MPSTFQENNGPVEESRRQPTRQIGRECVQSSHKGYGAPLLADLWSSTTALTEQQESCRERKQPKKTKKMNNTEKEKDQEKTTMW